MTQAASEFIQRWQGVQLSSASELASSQTFILELCALLDLPTPLPSEAQDYMFERPITFAHGDGTTSAGRIDCYKRGHFVWESKKLRTMPQAANGSKRFDLALLAARSQAENYARALPAAEITQGRPPFLIVADVGNVLEIYADFSRSGATYVPFPDPRHHRIKLADLADESIQERLRQTFNRRVVQSAIDAHRKRQQAAHPGRTLTGMYNVLEALRLHERAPAGDAPQLSAKEKLIHTQGLVAVLKTLHDELDSAVLAAYGLPEQISTDALLESLVQLNAQRAREEAAGRIRWLRPEFQDPAQRTTTVSPADSSLSKDERSSMEIQRVQADLALENEDKPTSRAPGLASQAGSVALSQQAWPSDLPAQILAVAQVLQSAPQALSLTQIEAHFKGRGAWKNSLPRILETLAALGKAQADGNTWRA